MHTIERIPLEGVRNTRDLGGFPAADGRTVRARRLIRSGELSRLTESDARILTQEYDLRQIIDFRTDVERAEKPDPEIPGVHASWNPILDGAALGITRETGAGTDTILSSLQLLVDSGVAAQSYMTDMYVDLVLNAAAQGRYARFFDLLLEQREGATLWHCTAGKDRVGVGTALLLSALGVDRALIVRDYLMTEVFSGDEMRSLLSRIPPSFRDAVQDAFGAQERYILAALAAIDDRYGTIDNYLNEALGLSKSRILALRSLYLA